MENITSDTLGFVYALFPGQTTWDKCYVIYKNCQLHFLPSIKSHAPKYVYVINEVIVRPKRKYTVTFGSSNLTKIDTLMICHQYDTVCLFVTLPAAHEFEVNKSFSPII